MSQSVILLEAGGRDSNPYDPYPRRYIKLLDHPTITWGFTADKDSGLNGREILLPARPGAGRVKLDQRPDLYPLPARGLRSLVTARQPRLGRQDVFPYFRKAENWEGPEDEVHAKGGPLSTSLTRDQPELCKAAIEAAGEMGWEYREDLNDLPQGLGDHVGWVQQTRGGRFRASAARTYLGPAMKRPNLKVVTGAMVHRLILEGKKAVGVEFSRGGAPERADAAGEVIVSGGAIGSPQSCNCPASAGPSIWAASGLRSITRYRASARTFRITSSFACRLM